MVLWHMVTALSSSSSTREVEDMHVWHARKRKRGVIMHAVAGWPKLSRQAWIEMRDETRSSSRPQHLHGVDGSAIL